MDSPPTQTCSLECDKIFPRHNSSSMLSFPVEEDEILSTKDLASGTPRRNTISLKHLVNMYDDHSFTLLDTFENSVKLFPNSNLIGWRPRVNGQLQEYTFNTYAQVNDIVTKWAQSISLLVDCSIGEGQERPKVGLFSCNKPQWLMGEYACYMNNLINVPIYDIYSGSSIQYICEQTDMQLCIASKKCALTLLQHMKESRGFEKLKTIIVMDPFSESDTISIIAKEVDIRLVSIEEMEIEMCEEAVKADWKQRRPSSEDLCTICYTSGTTGMPKGVMLTHSALVAESSGILSLAGLGKHADPYCNDRHLFKLGPDLIHLSYLPLSHVYERAVITLVVTIGASVGFFSEDITKIVDDAVALKPTLFITVPRLLNKLYDKIRAGIEEKSWIKRKLFSMAYDAKLYNLQKNGMFTHWFWDKVVFKDIKNRLGGNVGAMITGSAPCSAKVLEFVRICFSCEVYEGYGQTETCAASTLTVRGDWSSGQIGVPTPSVEVKLVSIPDMGYISRPSSPIEKDSSKGDSSSKPHSRGEICIRGPSCFIGYYKAPEQTREALDEDGWVHTGDVGEWDDRGRLIIIDRKKNIFKLAQGEYISPEKIETILSRNPMIQQAFVDGNSLKASLICVIVPEWDFIRLKIKEEINISASKGQSIEELEKLEKANNDELLLSPQVKKWILTEIKSYGKTGNQELKGFEIPRDVYFENEPFSIDNGLLTATFKLKRHEAKKKYASQIEEMYLNLD